jgi:hypothetical protein
MTVARAGKPLRSMSSVLASACLWLACETPAPGQAGPEHAAGEATSMRDAAFVNDAGMARGAHDAQPDGMLPDSGARADAGELGRGDCGAVPSTGRCLDATTIELCVAPSGGAVPPQRVSYACAAGEVCGESSAGAACVLASACLSGVSECADASTLRTCNAGIWLNQACAQGCRTNALGPSCAPQIATTSLSGSLAYEARLPTADYTNWQSTKVELPARRVLAVSYHDDVIIDAAYTGEDGAFQVLVPQTSSANDVLAFALVGGDASGNLLYAVADPGFEPALVERSAFDAPPEPNIWIWSYALADLTHGAALVVPESAGSGALRTFDTLASIYLSSQQHYRPTVPPTVLVWLGLGTRWDCGACTALFPTQLAATTFRHQVWLDGGSDQGYWSDAVTAHELGHFVMNAYGYAQAEGGPHYVGLPTHPGQAWSEGWATFFSTMQRASTRYYDKQGGAFFWFELSARKYGIQGTAWLRPSAANGLLQQIDENEVAALVHGVYQSTGKAPILDAIASPRMTVPPFERRYTMRVWNDPEHPEVYARSDEPLPYHADFFDALRCAGAISASALDAVTEPAQHYPYLSESALCR